MKGSSPVSSCAVITPSAHTSEAGQKLPVHASGDRYLRSARSHCCYYLSLTHNAFVPLCRTNLPRMHMYVLGQLWVLSGVHVLTRVFPPKSTP